MLFGRRRPQRIPLLGAALKGAGEPGLTIVADLDIAALGKLAPDVLVADIDRLKVDPLGAVAPTAVRLTGVRDRGLYGRLKTFLGPRMSSRGRQLRAFQRIAQATTDRRFAARNTDRLFYRSALCCIA